MAHIQMFGMQCWNHNGVATFDGNVVSANTAVIASFKLLACGSCCRIGVSLLVLHALIHTGMLYFITAALFRILLKVPNEKISLRF